MSSPGPLSYSPDRKRKVHGGKMGTSPRESFIGDSVHLGKSSPHAQYKDDYHNIVHPKSPKYVISPIRTNTDRRKENRGPSPGPSDYKAVGNGVDLTRRRSIGFKMGNHKRIFFTDVASKNANPGAGAYKEVKQSMVYKGAKPAGRYR